MVGCTEVEPESGCDPTPLSMVTLVAFVVVQTSDEFCPEAIVLGVAENETVGAAGPTVTGVCAVGGDEFAVVNALRV